MQPESHVVYVRVQERIVDKNVARVRREFEDYPRVTDADREERFVSINRLVKDDPQWAVSRIQHMNEIIPMLLDHIELLEKSNG
jgi:hypothetical protein